MLTRVCQCVQACICVLACVGFVRMHACVCTSACGRCSWTFGYAGLGWGQEWQGVA